MGKQYRWTFIQTLGQPSLETRALSEFERDAIKTQVEGFNRLIKVPLVEMDCYVNMDNIAYALPTDFVPAPEPAPVEPSEKAPDVVNIDSSAA